MKLFIVALREGDGTTLFWGDCPYFYTNKRDAEAVAQGKAKWYTPAVNTSYVVAEMDLSVVREFPVTRAAAA